MYVTFRAERLSRLSNLSQMFAISMDLRQKRFCHFIPVQLQLLFSLCDTQTMNVIIIRNIDRLVFFSSPLLCARLSSALCVQCIKAHFVRHLYHFVGFIMFRIRPVFITLTRPVRNRGFSMQLTFGNCDFHRHYFKMYAPRFNFRRSNCIRVGVVSNESNHELSMMTEIKRRARAYEYLDLLWVV